MVVHLQATARIGLRARRYRQFGPDAGAHRRIDAVKVHPPACRIEGDPIPFDRPAATGAIGALHPRIVQGLRAFGIEIMRGIGGNQRHVAGETAQKQRLAHAMVAGTDHPDALVGNLIAVTDRAIADEAALQRRIVHLGQQVPGPMIDHARRQQNGAGGIRAFIGQDPEMPILGVDRRDPVRRAMCAIALRLVMHPGEQRLAADPFRETGMVMRAWDHRGATRPAIEHMDAQVIAGEIDRRCQPRRPRADDDAIVHGGAKRERSQRSLAFLQGPCIYTAYIRR